MAIFNQNMRFLRENQGFKSVQAFADFLGEPRTKLAEYEKKAFPKDDFLQKLVDKMGIDLNMMINTELNDLNFQRLFTSNQRADIVQEPAEAYTSLDFVRQIEDIIKEENPAVRAQLGHQITRSFMTMVEQNGQLKDELVALYKKVTELLKL